MNMYNKSMTLAEAQLLALSTLKQVMEEKISSGNVEIAVVTAAEKQFRLLTVRLHVDCLNQIRVLILCLFRWRSWTRLLRSCHRRRCVCDA